MAERLSLPEQPTGIGSFVPGINADQEFLAIGASNVASGLLQGIPVNGSQSRSYVQRDADAEPIPGLLIYRMGEDHAFVELDDAVSEYLNP